MAAFARLSLPLLRGEVHGKSRSELTRNVRLLSTSPSSSKQAAFAFELVPLPGWLKERNVLTYTVLCSIDGVLKAGNTVLPAALRAIKILEGDNRLKKKVPYIFITNGGGPSEFDRARRLSDDFGVEVSESAKEMQMFSCVLNKIDKSGHSSPSRSGTYSTAVSLKKIWWQARPNDRRTHWCRESDEVVRSATSTALQYLK